MIRIELLNTALSPGQVFRGTVSWSEASAADQVQLSLLWATEGKGTQDVGVIERRVLSTGQRSGSADFELTAPDAPWSFSGTLVTLAWKVEALLTDSAECALCDVVIAPQGREVRL